MKDQHISADKNLLKTARMVSWLFTPFSIPFAAFVVLFLFSYLRIMPLQYKLVVLGVIYCFTIMLPTLAIFLFKKINGFDAEAMTQRRKRFVPWLLTILSYVFCLLMMYRMNMPWYMTGIILSALLIMLVCVVANLGWKLSEHMAGAGTVTGLLVAFSALFGYNPVWWLCVCILVSGLLGTARIVLGHHTLSETLAGYAVGLACTLLVLHPMSGLFFRLFFLH